MEASATLSELVESEPERYGHALAEAADDLAGELDRLGRLNEMERLARDLAGACRKLADTSPQSCQLLAVALTNLAEQLWKRRPEESLRIRAEVAAIYRRLAEADPYRFAPRLTSALDELVAIYNEQGRSDKELAAIRDAFQAYQARAKRIADIRHELMAAHKAMPSEPSRKSDRSRWHISLPGGEGRRGVGAAAMRSVAVLSEVTKVMPDEFLSDLADAVHGFALELKAAGKRREARILTDWAGRPYRYRWWEERPLDRMNDLALREWKLGATEAALTDGQVCRDLAPESRDQAWLVQLRSRLRDEWDVQGGRAKLCAKRAGVSYRRWWRMAKNNLDSRHSLHLAQLDLVKAEEKYSDALDTLAFRRQLVA